MPEYSRRWALREHSAANHAAVDAAIGGFDSLDAYKAYLRSIAAFRQPIETMLAGAAWPAAFGAWRPRPTMIAIAADMADLGVSADEGDFGPLALSGDRLFGAVYVLEGSALGARVLLQRALALGLSPTFGARHLALQGGSIDSWRQFLERLEGADPFDIDLALDGSAVAFAIARQAFSGASSRV
jgi:heme oxygenase